MALRYMTGGESHGPALVAILEGLPSGLGICEEDINKDLRRRQSGSGSGARMKLEKDSVQILSGVMEGKTIGSPMTLLLENAVHLDWADRLVPPFSIPRPGHADLAGLVKYGFNDIRPVLERASARETAIRVAVGAVCKKLLTEFNITVGGYVTSIGSIEADVEGINPTQRLELAEQNAIRCPDIQALPLMEALIQQTIERKDSLGGTVEGIALGLPVGLGSYVTPEQRLDACLGAAILSIPAFKGVEIGPAFSNTRQFGTQVHDAICLEGDRLIRKTNRCGGLEGGMTTGQPLVVRAAMKPIPTTLTSQSSVDISTKQSAQTAYERSDVCPVPRAVPVLEAVIALVLANSLLEKLGGDTMQELKERYAKLRSASLEDLMISKDSHLYWTSKPVEGKETL